MKNHLKVARKIRLSKPGCCTADAPSEIICGLIILPTPPPKRLPAASQASEISSASAVAV